MGANKYLNISKMKRFCISLNCSTSDAIQLLKENTDSPKGLRLTLIYRSPFYWGNFYDNQFKIWPKDAVNDLSAVYLTGEIFSAKGTTVIRGKIRNQTLFQIPVWLVFISIIIGFPSVGIAIFSLLTAGQWFIPSFLTFLASIMIILVYILQKTSTNQAEELEKFLMTALKNKMAHCHDIGNDLRLIP